MIRKIFLLLLIIFSIIWCGVVVFSKPKKNNEFVFWTIQLKGVADELIEENISQFKLKHPDINVVWIDIPIAETQKRILASTLSSTPPDLVNLNPDFSSVLAKKDALEFIDDKNLVQFSPEILNILKYEGKTFAIPFYATSSTTLYNKEIFKKAGINSVPKTYDELYKISDKISKVGKYSISINLNENDTFSKILNKYDIYNSETIENSGVLPYKLFKNYYDKNYISKSSLTLNHREIVEKYMAENSATIVVGANFIKMVKDSAPDIYKKSAVSTQLVGKNGKYDVALMNLVIPKKAKNKDLALEFAIQLTNKENQLKLSKLTGVLPVNKYALSDDYFKIAKSSEPIEVARIIGANQLNNLIQNDFGYDNKKSINDIINKTLENCLVLNKNIETEIKILADEIDKLKGNKWDF